MAGVWWLLFGWATAEAYETDQLTWRGRHLGDSTEVANAFVDELIAVAIRETNRRTDCGLSADETRAVLARQIYRQTSQDRLVWGRGFLRMFGHGRYTAYLETAAIDRYTFLWRQDIFGELSLRESVILKLMGTSSTVSVAGVRLGTDKFDHFFSEGYEYLERSDLGAEPERAIEWGTTTERLYFGLLTSRTFSFADLRANLDGLDFYAGLLGPDSSLGLDGRGCVVQLRPWSWAEWIDWEYDEVLNPSVYAPMVQWGLHRYLARHQDEICGDYARWAGSDYPGHLLRVLQTTPETVFGPYPTRGDPFQLGTLCGVLEEATGPRALSGGSQPSL